MPTIWISPTDFIGGPSLVITYPFPGHPSAQIQTTTPGTHRLLMALRLPEDVRIDAVTVCYQVGNPLSAISRLQLLEMGSPGTAPAIHDDTTTLQSTAPACHTSNVGGQVPTVGTALTLALELSFLSAVHRILLGGIGVKVSRIDGCENRHSLGEFGPYASVADARATFQQALATLIADGGGVLCIPRDAPEGFFPRNLEQSDKDGPAVTVLDYRKGFARLHAPPMGTATTDGEGRGCHLLERDLARDIGWQDVYSTEYIQSRYLGGASSYNQLLTTAVQVPVEDGIFLNLNQKLHVPSHRGLFVGQTLRVT
jgi:hypothetical protein